MHTTGADYTNVFRSLSDVEMPTTPPATAADDDGVDGAVCVTDDALEYILTQVRPHSRCFRFIGVCVANDIASMGGRF